jgi:hypothetical protein
VQHWPLQQTVSPVQHVSPQHFSSWVQHAPAQQAPKQHSPSQQLPPTQHVSPQQGIEQTCPPQH